MSEYFRFQNSGLSEADWDDFVEKSDNGTLFHKKAFLNYHQEKNFNDASLVFLKKERILALFPATIIQRDGIRIFSSHPGASWGGPVYHSPLSYQDTKRISEAIIREAKKLDCLRIEITLQPRIYQTIPSEYFSFILLNRGFVYQRRELNSVIRLDLIDDLLWSINKSAREEVSKSERRGIEIRKKSDDWEAFYAILTGFLEKKKRKPTHSLEELMLLKDRFADDIDLWSAYKDGRLVGGRCNWQVKPGIWLFFYCAYLPEERSSGILTRLYYECINDYHKKGACYIDLGTSSINMKANEGLLANKEHFLAYGIFRDTLDYEL